MFDELNEIIDSNILVYRAYTSEKLLRQYKSILVEIDLGLICPLRFEFDSMNYLAPLWVAKEKEKNILSADN